MNVVLIALGSILGLLLLAVGLGILWMRHKLGALQALSGEAPPPFRITVEPAAGPAPRHPEVIDQATVDLESVGYRTTGDYVISEMPDVWLRGLLHAESGLLAAVYDHPQAGCVVDVAGHLDDGTYLTITSGPDPGLDRPDGKALAVVEIEATAPGAAAEVHQRFLALTHGRSSIPAGDFVRAFQDAYAAEMDWRIERGGVTEDEIRRTAERSGEDPPAEEAIQLIRGMWRGHIDSFVQEECQKAFLIQGSVTASQWEEIRERVTVVHEYEDASGRMLELAGALAEGTYPDNDEEAEERAYQDARSRLAPLFESGSVRVAFAVAQGLLPEERRYRKIGAVEEPWPADIYVVQETAAVV